MNICVSIGHGKSAKGGYDSGALGGNYQEFKIGREIGKYIGEIFKGYTDTKIKGVETVEEQEV